MHPIWKTEITYLKKVGPVRAEVLAKECNIRTFGDLLEYFPRKYVDRSKVSQISTLTGDEYQVSLVGKITHIDSQKSKRGRGILTAYFSDKSGEIELTWFQGIKWISKGLKVGEEIAIFGKPQLYNGRIQITHPEIDRLTHADGYVHTGSIVPFYPSNEKLGRVGLDARGFRTILHQLMLQVLPHIQENLSPNIISNHQLIPRKEAYQHIHFPADLNKCLEARKRFIFEEFFFFQFMLASRRNHAKQINRSHPFLTIGHYFNTFFDEHIPFELTGAQKRVLKEIRKDLGKEVQMNRLIQGDVGSGKTMVAFMSMLMAKDNGFQSAMMAPTAILAEQHHRKLSAFAENLGMKVGLIKGGQRKKERTELLEKLASGETDILVGTHALIEDPVKFQRLGLVVVDEQHKFGVMQRAKLWKKADPSPHNMIMTATPIPRTLAMSLYGDVDVSVIDELPPGRKPIDTRVFGESKRLELFGFMRKQIEEGRQIYVVYPLVEESAKSDLLAVTKGFELLEKHFKPYKVGIVHGRMKPDAKEMEMQLFLNHKTHILVSTTVIEVGVDVPNASVIVIENSERFGLSQLHQLRGRVGRGAAKSYCMLMRGNKVSAEGRKRLKAMTDTQDGFKISEIDLEIRGPGDFLGTRQSGMPEFQLANIVHDQELLALAREAAFRLAEQDPSLQSPEHQGIRIYYQSQAHKYAGLSTVA
ncbi:MAG: ATP-dependent DNA helicase RecG [Bacteroidota bacterium]